MNESANIAYSYVKKLLQEEMSKPASTASKKKVAKKKLSTKLKTPKADTPERLTILRIMKYTFTYLQVLHLRMDQVQV
jgi:hypothetical protein